MKVHARFAALTCALLLLASAVAKCLADSPANTLTEAERRSGWKLVFDGKSTDGWRNYKQETISKGWQVVEGALSRVAGGAGDIVTVDQYENFELSIEYRISKGGNSGIMFHVAETADRPWQTGPEVQIQDNVDGHDPQKAGWLYQLFQPVLPDWVVRVERAAGLNTTETPDYTRPAGEWNHIYLRISAKQCEVALNGCSYYRFRKGDEEWDKRVAASKFSKFADFGKATRGHICLQDHGDAVAYRSIKIRELLEDEVVLDPSDGRLALNGVLAFPDLKWDDWEGVDEDGRVRPLRPIVVTHAGDGSGRIFAATQNGMIHVFPAGTATKRTKLFLDLRDQVADWKKSNEVVAELMQEHVQLKKELGEL